MPAVSCPSTSADRHQAGLTLVELLVSMVILSLVMVLVSQALFQAAKVAQVAESASAQLHSRWGQGWAARDLLSNVAAPPEGGEKPFVGDAKSISAYSLQPLDRQVFGPMKFTLEIQPDSVAASAPKSMLLRYTAGDARPGDMAAKTETVARLPLKVEFAYLDARGQWLEAWPPLIDKSKTTQEQALPRGVVIRESESKRLIAIYRYLGPQGSARPQERMFWENQ